MGHPIFGCTFFDCFLLYFPLSLSTIGATPVLVVPGTGTVERRPVQYRYSAHSTTKKAEEYIRIPPNRMRVLLEGVWAQYSTGGFPFFPTLFYHVNAKAHNIGTVM